MTPKTVSADAPAPSVASDKAKQLASLASRVGRPSAVSMSCFSARPISQVELAFLTRPVLDGSDQGHDGVDSPAVILRWRDNTMTEADQPGRIYCRSFDLGAAEIDTDAKGCGHEVCSPGEKFGYG